MKTETFTLVSGATGATGRAAIESLLKKNQRVRALVRKGDEKAAALRAQGVDVAVGDFKNIDGLRAALEGVGSAYFLYPLAPGIIEATAYFAQAAREAGVSAIVNMSQISARREAKSHLARDHWIAERLFDWSGIPTTHLRPTFFSEWLTYPSFGGEIKKHRHIQLPFESAPHAPIAAEDIGRLVGSILANPVPHSGQVYTLHGPVEMSYYEIAQAMSDELGVKISYSPISVEDFRRRMEEAYRFPPSVVQHLVEVSQDFRDGVFSGTNNIIERVTGEPPMTVQNFVSQHRSKFA